VSTFEYYGSSESAMIAGVRLAAQRRGLVRPGGSDGSWPLDWLDFEARPELAAAALDTVFVGSRRSAASTWTSW